jgi:predicted Zn-dependent protease
LIFIAVGSNQMLLEAAAARAGSQGFDFILVLFLSNSDRAARFLTCAKGGETQNCYRCWNRKEGKMVAST